MTIHKKRRDSPHVLAPGILLRKRPESGRPASYEVVASWQEDGTQRIKRWKLYNEHVGTETISLYKALREATKLRATKTNQNHARLGLMRRRVNRALHARADELAEMKRAGIKLGWRLMPIVERAK